MAIKEIKVTAEIRPLALANDTDLPDTIALENEFVIDNDGWALLAPFGEHHKTRWVEHDTSIRSETFVQIFDADSVADILANERGDGLLARLKRALIKRPIFEGHPDIKLYAPETVTEGDESMTPLGLVDACRQTERGLEARIQLSPQGAEAVAQRGCKFLSGVFLLRKTGVVRDDGSIEARPFRLASIGLTPHPNISGVDSLANANPNQPALRPNSTSFDDPMKPMLLGWLAAQGVALPGNAPDQKVFDALQSLWTRRDTSFTTLSNDKTSLAASVQTLTTERDLERQRAAEAVTALANEQAALKTERRARCEATVDLVITQGRLPVAERETKVTELTALGNEQFAAAVQTLKATPIRFVTSTATSDSARKLQANATNASLALANAIAIHTQAGRTKAEALELVRKEHPALHAAYVKEGGNLTL